jgi:Lipoxygenase
MTIAALMSTDLFAFQFWQVRKAKLLPGGGFMASAVRVERGHPPPTAGETRTLAEILGAPMRVRLRHDASADPVTPLPFVVIPVDELADTLPVHDLPDRWPSAADARRELGTLFGRPHEPAWHHVRDDSVLTRLATEGLGAHRLRARDGAGGARGYEIDLSHLARYPVRPPFEPYGARLLLGPSLEPEAIEREGVTARPGDASWDRFVFAFEASLGAEATLVDHSLTAHFAMAGSLVLALRSYLPEAHPLRDVLTPFTFATTAVNGSGVYSLLADRAYFSRLFALTYEGLCALLADAAAELRWETFPERLAAQGLASPVAAGAPLPFAADALLWWDAIDRFVAAVVERWAHPHDHAVQRFAAGLGELLPHPPAATRSGEPGDVREALRRMLGVAIFWITVMHEQVGDVIWYVQDPTWMPVKIRPGTAADQLLYKQETVQKMILGVLTAQVQMPLIHDALSPGFPDPAMDRAWHTFQADVRAVGAEIAARNARRSHPFLGLTPERIHLSVSL